MPLQVLKGDWVSDQITVNVLGLEDEEAFDGIRCPHCSWRPSASSLWCCYGIGTPEPSFEGCGMLWNTFSTKGLCPGCRHQWQWTSCLQCDQWSLHRDWYAGKSGRR